MHTDATGWIIHAMHMLYYFPNWGIHVHQVSKMKGKMVWCTAKYNISDFF